MQNQADALLRALRDMRVSTARAIENGPALTGKHVAAFSKPGVLIDTWLHKAAMPGRSVLFDFHGGGFALGDARKTDAMLSWVAQSSEVNVVSVAYRLAPENPYPAALDDAGGVIEWYMERASEFGFGESAYVQGYSAGANLALGAVMRFGASRPVSTLGADCPASIRGAVLHYPVLDAMSDPALKSVRAIDIPVEFMSAFDTWYVGGARADNPEISPVFATKTQLALLPKVIILPVVGDALCDEALLLGSRIKSAGGICEVMPVVGAYHGYIEDAANTAVYKATSFPETRDARPVGYRKAAERSMRMGLRALLGDEVRNLEFPRP